MVDVDNKYIYLFPFEKVPFNSRILIYGAGDVGQEYLKQTKVTGYCEVLGLIDRNYDKYPPMSVPIYAPEEIIHIEYDYIILAMKTRIYIKEITENLLAQGIKREKIIYVGSRKAISILLEEDGERESVESFAFTKKCVAIALKYGSGLGDCIVKKKLFEEIARLAPNCLIDIYVPHTSGAYIQSIYGSHPNLNLIIDNGSAVYEKNANRYALSMQVFFTLQIDSVKYDKFQEENTAFAAKIKLLQQRCEEYKLAPFPMCQSKLHFERMSYIGANYYTAFAYQGVFDINDTTISIPLVKEIEKDFLQLNLGKYITVNYGNGTAMQQAEIVAKQWPLQYFEEFVRLFKKNYPSIRVVQLGAEKACKVTDADHYILGESLELSKYVLKNALFHLDIEGGLVHLATQLGTKCIVLFGPTPVHFFGYKQNINIVSEKCSGCYCLYDDINQCARNLKEPECMYSITPENIMEAVKSIVN